MTERSVPESDWQEFRKLQRGALEVFSRRVLDELDRIRGDDSRTFHERYLDVFRRLQDRDDEMARAFNDSRRSTMVLQLATLLTLDLVRSEELVRFTPATRERATRLADAASG